MKILKTVMIGLIILNGLFSPFVYVKADPTTTTTTTTSTAIPCILPKELCDPQSAISSITGLLIPVASFALLIMLMYAGFTKLTAAGDAEKEKKSMQIIRAAIIGFAIIALASVIVGTIGSIFGVKLLPTS